MSLQFFKTSSRYLIEGATGVFTGSVYAGESMMILCRLICIFTDLSLVKSGYHGESRKYDGTTIVQKTHHTAVLDVDPDDENQEWRENHIKTFSGRGVLLIRNPYRAILSAWHHRSWTHTGLQNPLSFQSPVFRKFVFICINRYQLTHSYRTDILFF